MNKPIILLCLLLCLFSCERQSTNNQNRGNSKTNSETRTHSNTKHNSPHQTKVETIPNTPSKVIMHNHNGVYTVPIKINGMELNFIFDSGASDITISSAEAIVLIKQGKLKEEDIIGEEYYQIADGSIEAGTVINLRTVQIANKILHNVKATVVDNMEAPLLLGQSALSRFGKISIDYNNSTIEFQ